MGSWTTPTQLHFNTAGSYTPTARHPHLHLHPMDHSHSAGDSGHAAAPVLTNDATFDIIEWHPAYQSCQRYFLDHAQHEPGTQALCALINIRLPYQWLANPITSSSSPSSSHPHHPSSTNNGTTPPFNFSNPFQQQQQQNPQQQRNPSPLQTRDTHSHNQQTPTANFVSLVPYIRRLVVTAFDKPAILHGFFGDDYPRGVLPHLDCERRNYLFAAKHGGWRSCKKQYDTGSTPGGSSDESVPFMKPLDEARMDELTAAEKAWSGWLAMEDWMIGPRAPAESEGYGGYGGAGSNNGGERGGQGYAQMVDGEVGGQHQQHGREGSYRTH